MGPHPPTAIIPCVLSARFVLCEIPNDFECSVQQASILPQATQTWVVVWFTRQCIMQLYSSPHFRLTGQLTHHDQAICTRKATVPTDLGLVRRTSRPCGLTISLATKVSDHDFHVWNTRSYWRQTLPLLICVWFVATTRCWEIQHQRSCWASTLVHDGQHAVLFVYDPDRCSRPHTELDEGKQEFNSFSGLKNDNSSW